LATPSRVAGDAGLFLRQLRAMSVRGLARMFSPADRMFAFRVRRSPSGVTKEGLSPRYTAISLLGMAHIATTDVGHILGAVTVDEVFGTLIDHVVGGDNLGDVALSLWAAAEHGIDDQARLVARLQSLEPADREYPVVELAWAVSALSDAKLPQLAGLRSRVAARLLAAFDRKSKLFPHVTGGTRTRHVSCFADLIYPIQALAKYSMATGDHRARDVASECAEHLCGLQGESGQWWWHYDYRTGRVIERYPVYAIHQDAMGPMGLLALRDAGGADCTREIKRGLEWLSASPELHGDSLVDTRADLIWRKVARREPRKAVRYLQATASVLHSSLRVPAVDLMFPPQVIDDEDRPYHLGWLLYAWRHGDLRAQGPLGGPR
jgi:hypothetical protein